MMRGLFQSFQKETKCFKQIKEKKKEKEEEAGLKSSFFMDWWLFLGLWSSHRRLVGRPSFGGRMRASSAKFEYQRRRVGHEGGFWRGAQCQTAAHILKGFG